MVGSARGFPASLDENTLLGQYGEDFVRAVASACGIQHGIVSARDLLKADVTLTLPGRHGMTWNPGVWAQVKTTAHPKFVGADLRFDVDVDTHNVLCRPTQVPRVLIVVVAPGTGPLVQVTQKATTLLRAGYWTSWSGEQESTNLSSVTVTVPARNLLTPAAMKDMIITMGASTSSAVSLPDRFDS